MNEELNDKWKLHEVIQEALKTAHIAPSPETTQRLKVLEAHHNIFMDKLDKMADQINKISIDIAELPEKIFERGDDRYASKVTEKAVYALIGAIVLAVLYSLLNGVIK